MALKSPEVPELGGEELSAVKQLRAAFELQLLAEGGASIETWLTKVPSPARPVLFVELLDAEVSFHQRCGRKVRAEDYLARFPNLKHEIESVFSSLTMKPLHGSDDQSMDSTVDVVPGASSRIEELPNWLSGDFVGRYRLDKPLGHGAFGDVWKGFDPELRRAVAIKLPRKEVLRRLDLTSQFRDEARRAASLKDDGIVPVHDIGQVESGTFIVSEFVDGPTLAQRMKTERLPREEAVRIVIQLARSLHHAHRAGLVHRDIKPSNILMRPDGTPAITDFGLAISEEEQLTEQEGVVGTVAYMSPEQARGEGHLVDGRSDLYSLGVIFFQLLSGRPPFQFKTSSDLLDQIIHREVRPPRSIDDTIPVELDRICLRCLAKDVRERYSTGLDLAEDLETWNAGRRTSSMRMAMAAILFALLAIGIGYFAFGTKRSVSHTLPQSGVIADVIQPGTWFSLMDRPLEKFAFLKGDETDFLKPDPTKRELTLRSERNIWILATNHNGRSPLQIQGAVFMDEWIGNVGFVWAATGGANGFPKKDPQCFALLFERYLTDEPLRLCVQKLNVGSFIHDVPWVNHVAVLAETSVNIPANQFVALAVVVRENGIEVSVDGELVWKPVISDHQILTELVSTEGAVGVMGRGKAVAFREVTAMFQDRNRKGTQ